MAHTETTISGQPVPSVTQVIGIMDKAKYLVPWAAKHGTLKALALRDAISEAHCLDLSGNRALENIPDEWFTQHKLTREAFWKSHEEIGNESRERGQEFHRLVEEKLRQKFNKCSLAPNTVSLPADPFVNAVEMWVDRAKFLAHDFERLVKSQKYRYAGTFDCLGNVGEHLVIVDWKRTGSIDIKYSIQLGGYAQAYFEETGEKIHEGRIVRPYQLKRCAKEDGCELIADGYKWAFAEKDVYVEEKRFLITQGYIDIFLKCREIWDFLNSKGLWV